MSQPAYQQPITVAFALDFLARQIANSDHEFWPDDISLLDTDFFDRDGILGPRQITDVYLLALAAKHGGRLVTMDTAIPHAAARHAGPEHLVVI